MNLSLQVEEGDEITGRVDVKPNAKNPRDMDIKLSYDFAGKYKHHKSSQDFFLR
tara:strand:+ start:628 stop:789 length:162 start_codon:yes stop_codon:yes gene_type:complete